MEKVKTVIITGASSGIGMATARVLAANGFNLMLSARRTDRLEELKAELGENVSYMPCDVTDPLQVAALVSETKSKFGGVDVLVNNAGLGHMGPLEETPLEEWHRMMDVNVKGLLNCIHYTLPYLIEAKGNIINLSSVAAHGVFPNAVVYCATKHAVAAISQGLRLELRGRVKVTDISPGAVETEFANQTSHEATSKHYKENVFNGVVLKAEDIGNAILDVLQKPDHIVISEVIIRPNQ